MTTISTDTFCACNKYAYAYIKRKGQIDQTTYRNTFILMGTYYEYNITYANCGLVRSIIFFFPDNTQYQNVLKECQRTNSPNMLVPHLAHIIVVKKTLKFYLKDTIPLWAINITLMIQISLLEIIFIATVL